MKPKTKLHLEVWNLHQKLSNPKEHEPFVISKHEFYYTTHYKNLICLECNHSWKPSQVWHEEVLGVKCPSCNQKLKKISTENGGMVSRFITYSVVKVVDRFQVTRYFSCWKHMSKNKIPRYGFHSLFEEWKDWDKNKSVIVGRTKGWTGDGFNSTEYEIRYINNSGWHGNPYAAFSSDYNCPRAEFLPRFQKYGLTKYKHDCDYRILLDRIEHSPKIETLLKSRQKELLEFALYKDSRHNTYWDSIKIVIRNNYKIKDAGIWYDYLDLLRYFKKDLHNAVYVCPKNLKKEHDRWMKKKREIIRLQEIENERLSVIRRQQKLEKAIVDYVERWQKFFDLEFKKGNISISVLKSIEEFKEEGDELKHCVYTNEYYLKEKSLILSAKVDGKRAETIELKLPELKIEQSRGLKNEATKHHEEIIKLVENNLEKIRKIVIKTKPRGKSKSAA
ncbi:PcfJ domain-containing protein [Flavobacterium sp. ZT3R17]|uniref:PcfJ domain-containing protein n=1 Tax=Flavobacterium cryoconiti TaxID=3398736 RepID=UPI003A83FCD9